MGIAGIVIYATVLAVIFVIFKKDYHIGIIIMIPVTLVFSLLSMVYIASACPAPEEA